MRRPRLAVIAGLVAALALPAPALAYTQRESIVSSGHGYASPMYLVIHETANPGASAYNHYLLYSRGYAYAVQYVMELDGSVVYHTMADDRLAWAVGRGNPYCVNIELAHATTKAQFDAQWAEAVKWAGDYLHRRGWDVNRMISHNSARIMWGGTDHTDPVGYFGQYGRTFSQFRDAVARYMRTGQVSGTAGQSTGGTVQTPSKPSSSAQSSFAGTYTVMVAKLNVRSGPGTGYPVVASYTGGQKVALEGYRVVSGYVWGTYRSYSGKTRWVCVGPQTGGTSSRDYLVKGGAYRGSSQAQQQATAGRSYGAGRYTFKSTMNVRSGPGTGYRAVATYKAGQSVSIDRTVTANGYVWGAYTSYSGATRYVALGTTSGTSYVR